MSYKYFRCEWIREEPNDNLETYLKVKDELLLEEYIKKNKGKTIEEIETEEMLQDIKKELFGC
jgi:hypothetical protein